MKRTLAALLDALPDKAKHLLSIFGPLMMIVTTMVAVTFVSTPTAEASMPGIWSASNHYYCTPIIHGWRTTQDCVLVKTLQRGPHDCTITAVYMYGTSDTSRTYEDNPAISVGGIYILSYDGSRVRYHQGASSFGKDDNPPKVDKLYDVRNTRVRGINIVFTHVKSHMWNWFDPPAATIHIKKHCGDI